MIASVVYKPIAADSPISFSMLSGGTTEGGCGGGGDGDSDGGGGVRFEYSVEDRYSSPVQVH